MPEFELFTTPDLYDGKSIVNVTNSLVAFSRAANKKGYKGKVIGPKGQRELEQNKKHWEVGTSNNEVSKLNEGSSKSMEKSVAQMTVGPTWKAEVNVDSETSEIKISDVDSGINKTNLPTEMDDMIRDIAKEMTHFGLEFEKLKGECDKADIDEDAKLELQAKWLALMAHALEVLPRHPRFHEYLKAKCESDSTFSSSALSKLLELEKDRIY
mmetsp:Transcript_5693/g.6740  ORF Transcript_5693/g.6740 Transcript_5693/m.6740 type:complete len:212 (+) Transcript_5693:81-716(+)